MSSFDQSRVIAWIILFSVFTLYLLSTVVFCTIVKWITRGRVIPIIGVIGVLCAILVISVPNVDVYVQTAKANVLQQQ